MTTQTPDAVREALQAKHDRIHPTNRRPDLPIMLKMTFGNLCAILAALDSRAGDAGEGVRWPEPKFVAVESGAKLNPERVEAAFQLINGEMVIGEQVRLVEMILDGTDYTVVPATPASHASDGGKA